MSSLVNVHSDELVINQLSLGIQTDYSWKNLIDVPAYSTLLQAVNIKLVRVFDFRPTTPKLMPCTQWNEATKTGTWNWTNVDAFTRKVFGIGAEPLFCLGWATNETGIISKIPPGMTLDPVTKLPNPASYAAYASEWVRHFKQVGLPVRLFEVMNEPNAYFLSDSVKIGYFSALFKASYQAMKAENPDIIVGNDCDSIPALLDYWLSHGIETDSINFHKYDGYGIIDPSSPSYRSDSQIFGYAESRCFTSLGLGRSVTDSRNVYYQSRGKVLPIMNTEANVNAHWETGTDIRNVNMVGAVWLALVLRTSILKGLSIHVYFNLESSYNWEKTKPMGGAGFAMINSDNKKPWAPYYVYRMIGPNIGINDKVLQTDVADTRLRVIAWLHESNINVLLINRSHDQIHVQLVGTPANMTSMKVNESIPFENMSLIEETANASDILLSGYTVQLLRAPVATGPMNVGVDYWSGFTASTFLSRDAVLLREAGLKILRLSFNPGSLSNLNSLVPAVKAQGLDVLGLLYNRSLLDANDLAGWGAWVRSTVSAFKSYVKVWEVWNEPDWNTGFGPTGSEGDVAKYVQWLQVAYQQAKIADPTCIVLGGSLSCLQSSTLTWLANMYGNGAKNFMDGLSVHPYCGNSSPLPPNQTSGGKAFWKIQDARDIMVAQGDAAKPVWVTEDGWSTSNVSDALQAQHLADALIYAKSNYPFLETFIIYQWQDGGGFNFGLMREDGSLKPSYEAVKQFTSDTATLAVTSTPINVAFTINLLPLQTPYNQALVQGTYTVAMPIAVGNYRFKNWEDGTTNPTRTINLDAITSMIATYELYEPEPVNHSLVVTSTPIIGFAITVDGYQYTTPTQPITLLEGFHTLVAPSNVLVGADIYNFKHWEDDTTTPSRTIDLKDDLTAVCTYELPPPPPPKKGTLDIHAQLDSQEITVPYEIVGVGNGNTPATVEVNVGSYTVKATYQNLTKSLTVQVTEGQTIRVDFQFTATDGRPIVTWLLGLVSQFRQRWQRST